MPEITRRLPVRLFQTVVINLTYVTNFAIQSGTARVFNCCAPFGVSTRKLLLLIEMKMKLEKRHLD